MSHISKEDIIEGLKNQIADIPWVIVKQMFQSLNTFPIESILTHKTTPDIIAQLITYFGKNTMDKDKTNDCAIYDAVTNTNLTDNEKLEIIVMLIESYVYCWFSTIRYDMQKKKFQIKCKS